MARPMNKIDLIAFSEEQFAKLLNIVDSLTVEQRDSENVFLNRTTKDIIAHIYAWQALELNWYAEGMKGVKPAIPAPGYTFKDTPALNEKLYLEYKNIKWQALLLKFTASHNQLLSIIKSHSETELFTKKTYKWTGSTDLASYFRSALFSHYVWGFELVRKYFKNP